MQVKGRNQSNLLSAHDKGKLQLGDNGGKKQNPVIEQRRLSEMPVSIPGPTTLRGRDVGSRRINVELNLGETNPVGNKRIFPLKFNSNLNESVYVKEHELRNSYRIGEGLTVEVNGEGKRRVAWNSNKGGLRSSKWVTRSQREHMVGPSSGSQFQKDSVVGSDQFRRVAGNSNKGGLRSSKWFTKSQREHVMGPSSRSLGQSLSPTLAQTGLGSNQSNEVCFSGPSIHEMGKPSSMTSPTPLTHSMTPMISPSDKPESLMSSIKVSKRQVEPLLLISCNCSDGISFDSLMVTRIEVGINSC